MKEIPHKTLTECLDLLEQGLGVEEILARFPGQEEALRPFLNTAARLSGVAYSPSLAARRHSRDAALREVDALQAQRTPLTPVWFWLQQAFRPALSFALLLILFAVALPLLAAPAVPGDTLYGAKRFVEEARLSLAAGPDSRADLLTEFNAERIREVEALLENGRSAEVQFRGAIMQIEPDYWTVASIRAYLAEDTVVEGSPWLSGSALVQGRTADGRLLASRLVVLEQPPPSPTPPPAATPLPAATATPSPSPTPSATATATATATVDSTPTLTDTPQPLPSSTPALLASPTPPPPLPTADDGEAGNENDDDNDNDDVNDNGDDDNDNDDANDNDDDDDNDNGDDDDNDNGDDDANDNDDDEEERDDDNSDDDS